MALKMLEPLSSGLSYAFHDITQIVEAYLDDLAAHSKKRADRPAHLRAIFRPMSEVQNKVEPVKMQFLCYSREVVGLHHFHAWDYG